MFIYIYIYTCQYEIGRTKVTYILRRNGKLED